MKQIKIIGTICLLTLISLLSYNFIKASSGIDESKANNLYKKHCSKCHRISGDGIKKVYPPIKNSDYIKNSTSEELLRGMLFGRTGKVIVNGVTYNGVMTTEIDGNISDDDIALILSYIYQNFNSINKNVNPDEVKKARKAGKLPAHK